MKYKVVRLLIYLCLIFTIGGSGSTWAQSMNQEGAQASRGTTSRSITIKARVYDPQGRTVPHAQVTLHRLPSGARKTTATDASGTFSLSNLSPGTYQIRVQAPGFQTLVIRRQLQAALIRLTINLRIKAAGEQIQVTSTPEISTEQRVPGTALSQSQTQDTAESLRYLPGVSVIRRGPINMDPVVRGLQANEVPTFVNGAQTFAVCAGRMDSGISHVSPYDIQSVRVVKGPYALTWGPGTMSAIQVKTFEPPFQNAFRVHGRIGFNYGTNAETPDAYANLWGANSNITVGLFHDTRTGSNYHAGNGQIIPAHYEVNDNRWNLGLHPSRNTLFRYTGGFEEDNNVDYPGRLLNAKYFLVRSHNFTFDWQPESGSITDVGGRFNIDRLGHLMNNSGKPTALPMPGRMPPYALNVQVDAHSDTVGGGFHVSMGHSKWTEKIGTDFYHRYQNSDRSISQLDTGTLMLYDIIWPQAVQDDEGAYGQVLFHGDRTQLGGTLRVDGVQTSAGKVSSFFLQNTAGPLDRHEVNVSAALDSKFRITENWSVTAGVGRVVTTPTILERYSDRFPSTEFQLSAEFMGNPSLRPEQSLEFDLGSSIRFEGINMQVSLYHRHIDNYVTIEPDPSIPRLMPMDPPLVYRYINGNARYYGGDVLVARSFGKYIGSSAAVSYTWAEDMTLDEPVIGIPPLRGDVRLALHSPTGRERIQAEAILDDHQDRVATSRYEIPTAGYAIFNLESFYELTSHWTLRAGVENLGNRYYWDHLDAMNPFTHQPIPEVGRNAKVGFEYRF